MRKEISFVERTAEKVSPLLCVGLLVVLSAFADSDEGVLRCGRGRDVLGHKS